MSWRPNDDELINALEQSKQSRTFAAKRLAPFFSIDVTLKIFGVTIFRWSFPPGETPTSQAVDDGND